MVTTYDARGNVCAVATPAELRRAGVPLPTEAADAAQARAHWAGRSVAAFCGPPRAGTGGEPHGTDGLLIGPFGDAPPFDLLVVNTDGTLAERSGNGLTIFARALADKRLVGPGSPFVLRVHHDKPGVGSPTTTTVEVVQAEDGGPAFWLDLGAPLFGPGAVGAHGPGVQTAGDDGASRVARLVELDPAWARSVFVRIGNPHCVTLLPNPAALPDMGAVRAPVLHAALARIAFAPGAAGVPGTAGAGDPCPAGVNLQWAARAGEGRLAARVFERGEGPTASSGTSAAAVACAAHRLGLVPAGVVIVDMPGGAVPLELVNEQGQLSRVRLLGVAAAITPHGEPGRGT